MHYQMNIKVVLGWQCFGSSVLLYLRPELGLVLAGLWI